MRFTLSTPQPHFAEVVLFRDIQNAAEVVDAMKKGNVQAALVDARLVTDIFPVLVAVSTALRRLDDGDNITRNPFTEIVYHLSPSRNISSSLKNFGINATTTDVVAVVPDAKPDQLSQLRKLIQATEQEPTEKNLAETLELAHVHKVYDIDPQKLQHSTLVDAIVTRMACRDIK